MTEALSLEQGREALRFANSFNRLPKLIDLAWSMGWADWMTLIGEEWESCDNIGQWLDELLEETPFADVLDDAALGKWLMNDDERVALAMLPGEVEIFRGCYEVNKWGLSWSLDRNVAAKFPTLPRYRQPGQPLLVRAAVKRENIIALKLGREEAEVVAYRPKHISTAHLQSISDDER